MGEKPGLQRDPLDEVIPQKKGVEQKSGPLDTPPPIEDPGEADREKLLREAESDVRSDITRPDRGLPPD